MHNVLLHAQIHITQGALQILIAYRAHQLALLAQPQEHHFVLLAQDQIIYI